MPAKKKPLSETHPQLCKEWDAAGNGALSPDNVSPQSAREVWWQCMDYPLLHIWAATISERTSEYDKGCPICFQQNKYQKETLANIDPVAALQWHPTKNGSLKPSDVAANSRQLAWWVCPQVATHEWREEVGKVHRAVGSNSVARGCPLCKKTDRWDKSVAEAFPILLEEWHKTKNGSRTPYDFTPGSGVVVWWKCKKRHAYELAICLKTAGRGCPYCSNKRILLGLNSLADTHPDLAKEWHCNLNGEITPEQVTAGSDRRAWWRCSVSPEEHIWDAKIYARGMQGKGCPFCGGKKVNSTNSLRATYPEIAREWHPTKNLDSGLTPDSVTRGSMKKIWWQCKRNPEHSWQAQINKRTEGRGLCPGCNPRSKPIVNDFEISHAR